MIRCMAVRRIAPWATVFLTLAIGSMAVFMVAS
jgi:hypothetical protein